MAELYPRRKAGVRTVREFLLAMVVAFTVTLLLGGPVRALAVRFGAVGTVRERDVHTVPTPRVGGIAMFGGFAAALTLARHFPMVHKAYTESTVPQALLLGGFLVVLLGVVDDKFELGALVKLAGQIFAASVMVIQGVQITFLPIPGFGNLVLDPTFGVVLSVLFVLVLMNAVNFVDGLDGLAAGISCIAALATFAYADYLATSVNYGLTGAVAPALFSAVIVGMCLGFLVHNWSPARMFMGDTGSMLLGLALAASAITITGQIDPQLVAQGLGNSETTAVRKLIPVYIPLILPISVSLLPLADMFMAIVRRTKAGRSPLSADKEHLHHRLLQIGHSPRRAVLIMYFWSALVAFVTVLFSVNSNRKPVVYVAIAMTLVGLLLLLSPRLVDHRDRLRSAASTAANRAMPDKWLGAAQPKRKHRAGHVAAAVAGTNGATGAGVNGSGVNGTALHSVASGESDGSTAANASGGALNGSAHVDHPVLEGTVTGPLTSSGPASGVPGPIADPAAAPAAGQAQPQPPPGGGMRQRQRTFTR